MKIALILGAIFFVVIDFILIFIDSQYSKHVHIWRFDNKLKRELCYEFSSIRMPGSGDVNFDETKTSNEFSLYDYQSKIKLYNEEVILPAKEYFSLKNRLESYLYRDDGLEKLIAPIQANIFFWLPFCCVFFENKPKIAILSFLFLIVILASTLYFISFLLGKFILSNSCFSLSFEQIKSYYDTSIAEKKYNISSECALNNYIICEHYEYLKRIEHKCLNIFVSKKTLKVLTVILYLIGLFCVCVVI